MNKEEVRLLPVVDRKRKFKGVVSMSNIAEAYMDLSSEDVLQNSNTKFENLLKTIKGKLVKGEYPTKLVTGKIYADSTLSKDQKLEKGDIVIVNHNKYMQRLALKSGAGCIIFTNSHLSEEILNECENKECAIVDTDLTFFKVIKKINQSISVSELIKNRNFIYFKPEYTLDEIKEIIKDSKFSMFPIVNKNGELLGTIHDTDLIDYNRKKVILVDHNEFFQSIDGIKDAHILEIVDHHRISNITTADPLYIHAEPVGSTCTIISKLFERHNIKPSKKIAGLMLSAILSDTLIFKSPTCTEEDKIQAEKLSKITNLNIEEYGMEMLVAGTQLTEKTDEELVNSDLKQYTFGKHKISITQVQVVSTQELYKRLNPIHEELEKTCDKYKLDGSILALTNIIKERTKLVFVGKSKELIGKAFNIDPICNLDELPILEGVVSRKKQLVPKLDIAAKQ